MVKLNSILCYNFFISIKKDDSIFIYRMAEGKKGEGILNRFVKSTSYTKDAKLDKDGEDYAAFN